MKLKSIFFVTLMLTGCATTDNQWVERIDGNDFNITSGRVDGQSQERFIRLTRAQKEWYGSVRGGEEKLQARKDLMVQVAQKEAARICQPNGVVQVSEPSFDMIDTNPQAFGGGLVGVLIAAAASDYENLPSAGFYNFLCEGEKGDAELELKK